MSKYLIIHSSIKFIMRIALFIAIAAMLSSIYVIIYHSQIIEVMTTLMGDTWAYFNKEYAYILLIGGIIIMSIVGMTLHFKRWSTMAFLIVIALPFLLGSLWLLGYMIQMIYKSGFDDIDRGGFLIWIGIILLVCIGINATIWSFRLFRDIKKREFVPAEEFTRKKPSFLLMLFGMSLPFFWLLYLIYTLSAPVKNIDIPKQYLRIENLDLENPTYTEPSICQTFEWSITEYPDISALNLKKDEKGYSGSIYFMDYINTKLYMGMLLERARDISITGDTPSEIEKNLESKYPEEYSAVMQSSDLTLSKMALLQYQQENSELWWEVENKVRNNFSPEWLQNIRDRIDAIPDEFRCYFQNNDDLSSELFPKLNHYIKLAKILHLHGKKALFEKDINNAIIILASLHDLGKKYYKNNDITLVGNIIGVSIVNLEYTLAEEIISESNEEQKWLMRDMYSDPVEFYAHEANGWRGEYYFYEHMLTGRNTSITSLSLPFIFDGKDMYARGSLLVFLQALAKANNDTELMNKIQQTLAENDSSFSHPIERLILWRSIWGWKGDFPFYWIYNPLGKYLNASILTSLSWYHEKIRNIAIYQDYIRKTLLEIP